MHILVVGDVDVYVADVSPGAERPGVGLCLTPETLPDSVPRACINLLARRQSMSIPTAPRLLTTLGSVSPCGCSRSAGSRAALPPPVGVFTLVRQMSARTSPPGALLC